MELLGAEVRTGDVGSRTLKDAVNEAMREWVATVETTHYCLGSVMGPHPFPYMVRQFQRVVGDEAREQCRDLLDGADPDVVVACVGGGSNAAGTFAGFVDTAGPAGRRGGGRRRGHHQRHPGRPPRHALAPAAGRGGADPGGGVDLGRAGLPGLGPEHAHLAAIGRAEYSTAGDDEVLEAFRLLSHTEGIIPALESAHAVAWVAAQRRHRRPAGRVDRADHPVGPGRQGRGPGARDLRPRAPMPDLEKELRAAARAWPQAADPVPHGRA